TGRQPPARFRPKLPGVHKSGEWSWYDNPFVATQAFRGLLVLNLMVNNWDLKTSNNVVYKLASDREGARRWFVVKDVGASLGKTPGWLLDGRPNDLAAFEAQGFIVGADGGKVRFDYRRPHTDLLERLTSADVRWTCARLARLTPEQWRAAFRAGGYDDDQSTR